MAAVGIVKGLKLLVGRNEGIDQVHGILEVDIVISRAMNQQEVALQLIYMGDGRVVIVTSRIQLGRLQVALGVDRIIIPPGSHWRHRDGSFKHIISDHQGKRGHVAPVGPTPNSYSPWSFPTFVLAVL